MSLPYHLRVGQETEVMALAWYLKQCKTARIIAKNWRVPQGEIDIVIHEPSKNLLVFLEVRKREAKGEASGSMQSGIESVSPAKLRRLKRAIDLYVMHEELPEGLVGMQLDVLDYDGREFKHFENILFWD